MLDDRGSVGTPRREFSGALLSSADLAEGPEPRVKAVSIEDPLSSKNSYDAFKIISKKALADYRRAEKLFLDFLASADVWSQDEVRHQSEPLHPQLEAPCPIANPLASSSISSVGSAVVHMLLRFVSGMHQAFVRCASMVADGGFFTVVYSPPARTDVRIEAQHRTYFVY